VTDRFERFAAKKRAEALAARLDPWRTEIERPAAGLERIGNDWTRSLFGGDFYASSPPPHVPSTSLVFVQSRDGNTVANDPSALGGGGTDKHVVYEGLSRVAADAVLAGAETIRGGALIFSVWHPELVALRASLGLPRHPIQIVATLRGIGMDGTLLFNEPDVRIVVLTIPAYSSAMHHEIAQRPWITPVIMRDAHDLHSAFAALRRLGIARVSCVGGRTLAQQLIDAHLVQDLYLTTSPRDGGTPGTPLYPGTIEGETVVTKRATGADEGVAFAHLRRLTVA